MNPLRHVRPGEPVKVAASVWNKLTDEVKFHPRAEAETHDFSRPNFTVRLKNFTTNDLDRWGVVQIESLLEVPTGVTGPAVDSFQSWPGVVGTEPGYGSATTKAYAVAVEPIKVGEIGYGAIAGVVQARVQMRCTGHQYAKPKYNEVGYMESADAGPFRIMWVGATGPWPTGTTGPGTPWALLLFGTERTHEAIPGHTTGAVQLLGHGQAATGASGCDTGLQWYTMTECSGNPSYATSYFL